MVTDPTPHKDTGGAAAGGSPDPVLAAGFTVRRAVLGDAHVDRAVAATDEFTADFQDLVTRYAWGDVWAREGLDRRTRSALTLALLTALRATDEIPMHVRAALTNGLSRDDVKEVLLHTAIYAGLPPVNSAFAIAQRVFAELDGADVSPPGQRPGTTTGPGEDSTRPNDSGAT